MFYLFFGDTAVSIPGLPISTKTSSMDIQQIVLLLDAFLFFLEYLF